MFINQIREKIGVMFGSPETTSGGRALKFYSSVRIDISAHRCHQRRRRRYRLTLRASKVVKNKVAAPFRQAEFDIDYGEGISRVGELVDLGVEHKIVSKSGAWYGYGDVRLGQGRENSKHFLRANLDLAHEIENKIRTEMDLPLRAEIESEYPVAVPDPEPEAETESAAAEAE